MTTRSTDVNETKQCSKCRQVLPLGMFSKDKQAKSGLRFHCKPCCLTEGRTWARRNKDRLREVSRRNYVKNGANWAAQTAARQKEYQQRPEVRARKKEWSKANRLKVRAQSAVARAKRQGLISNPGVCVECGSSKNVHAHHDDYSKPLDIRWLCNKCHWLADCERREKEAAQHD